MEITPLFIIHKTEHWILNHHLSSALPGYVMLGSRLNVSSLAQLPEEALAELGGLLAKTQEAVDELLKPKWLYVSRFGHVPGYPIHFHFIPVYHWVEELFWADSRYRLLETFATSDHAQSQTDGAELTLFIWREFGEGDSPPQVQGLSISQAIERLRAFFD